MKRLSIDVETYSETDLTKTGVYRYAEDPAFEIMLFGVAVDDGPVTVYDLTKNDVIPAAILSALQDPGVEKWAFNAMFERITLSRYLWDQQLLPKGQFLSPEGWRCSMIWSAYMGFPMSLAGAGAALGLEQQKMTEGKDLIRYFCGPCKATASNGGRTRNLPADAPDKWETFVAYNRRDVEVELQIKERLAAHPVPEAVWHEYWADQRINDRGVLIDTELVNQAIRCDAEQSEEMYKRACEITGLENPNSVVQLKAWLEGQGVNVPSLGKKDVSALLENASGDVLEMLKLRLQMSKSSVKKYQAAERCACKDGRARGLFQFSGANRTQRWCLAEGSPVLVKTKEGQILNKAIEDVEITDMVFDGDNWVRHEGVVYSGDKAVISYDGITATPDHIVYINNEKKMKLGEAMAGGVKLWNLA